MRKTCFTEHQIIAMNRRRRRWSIPDMTAWKLLI